MEMRMAKLRFTRINAYRYIYLIVLLIFQGQDHASINLRCMEKMFILAISKCKSVIDTEKTTLEINLLGVNAELRIMGLRF